MEPSVRSGKDSLHRYGSRNRCPVDYLSGFSALMEYNANNARSQSRFAVACGDEQPRATIPE